MSLSNLVEEQLRSSEPIPRDSPEVAEFITTVAHHEGCEPMNGALWATVPSTCPKAASFGDCTQLDGSPQGQVLSMMAEYKSLWLRFAPRLAAIMSHDDGTDEGTKFRQAAAAQAIGHWNAYRLHQSILYQWAAYYRHGESGRPRATATGSVAQMSIFPRALLHQVAQCSDEIEPSLAIVAQQAARITTEIRAEPLYLLNQALGVCSHCGAPGHLSTTRTPKPGSPAGQMRRKRENTPNGARKRWNSGGKQDAPKTPQATTRSDFQAGDE